MWHSMKPVFGMLFSVVTVVQKCVNERGVKKTNKSVEREQQQNPTRAQHCVHVYYFSMNLSKRSPSLALNLKEKLSLSLSVFHSRILSFLPIFDYIMIVRSAYT